MYGRSSFEIRAFIKTKRRPHNPHGPLESIPILPCRVLASRGPLPKEGGGVGIICTPPPLTGSTTQSKSCSVSFFLLSGDFLTPFLVIVFENLDHFYPQLSTDDNCIFKAHYLSGVDWNYCKV